MSVSSSLNSRTGGRLFSIVRVLVVAEILLAIVLLAFSLANKATHLSALQPGTDTGFAFYGWTPQQLQAAMAEIGIYPEIVTGMMLACSLVCLACFWGMGGLLFWRKSNTWMGLLGAFILFMIGPGFSSLLLTEGEIPPWLKNLLSFQAGIIWPTFFVMLYLFPNGKFVPRFSRFLAPFPYLLFFSKALMPSVSLVDVVGPRLLILYAVGGLVSQIYRYRRISTPDERQQVKWVVFALGIFIGFLVLTPAIPSLFPTQSIGSPASFFYEFFANATLGVLAPALIPLAIGIAILRYHLWDIDVIIRRTLVYGALTVILGLFYFGSVILLQQLFRGLSGQDSQVAIIISTLAIAALFNPLRRRVQEGIDRRFYRRKYNAEQAIERFAATARQEMDLEQLSAELLAVVEKTMQPEHVSLWMSRVKK